MQPTPITTRVATAPLPPNANALLYRLDSLSVTDERAGQKLNLSLIKTYMQRVRILRDEKITKMQAGLNARDIKSTLRARWEEINVRRALENAQKYLKSWLSRQSEIVDRRNKQRQRILSLLNDVEGTEQKIMAKNPDEKASYPQSIGQAAVNNALATSQRAAADLRKTENLQKDSHHQELLDSLDEQKGAIHKILSALKKQRILGKVFRFIPTLVLPLVSALMPPLMATLGIGNAILQSLVAKLITSAADGLMQLSAYIANRPVIKNITTAKMREHLATDHAQDLMKRIFANEEVDHRIQRSQNQTLANLENTLRP